MYLTRAMHYVARYGVIFKGQLQQKIIQGFNIIMNRKSTPSLKKNSFESESNRRTAFFGMKISQLYIF